MISVGRADPGKVCIACDGRRDLATLVLAAESRHADHPMGLGADMPLCDAHAIRMWQALSAMLVLGDEPLLKLVRNAGARSAPVPTARGKALL